MVTVAWVLTVAWYAWKKSLVRRTLGQFLLRKRRRRGPKRQSSEPRRTFRHRHPRRMKRYATKMRKPETTSVNERMRTYATRVATRVRKPETTRGTEAIPPRAAA